MEKYEYKIVSKKGVNILTIDEKIQTHTTSSIPGYEHIPEHCITCSDACNYSTRFTSYYLTEEEKTILETHPDILEISPVVDIEKVFTTESSEIANFYQPYNATAMSASWYANASNHGLALHSTSSIFYNEIIGFSTDTNFEYTTSYDYVLDGTGVDVIIMDFSFFPSHLDFKTLDGNRSRFNAINWPEHLSISNSFDYSSAWYNDVSNSHGGRVGSIVAGRAYGWAKNSEIYYVRYSDYGFDLCRLFHESKSIDPSTGYKRPTVVACSIGAISYPSWFIDEEGESISYIDKYYYSGSLVTDSNNNLTVGLNQGVMRTAYPKRAGWRYTPYDAAVEEMTDAGVIFVTSAGNDAAPQWDSGSTSDPNFNPSWYGIHAENYYTYSTSSMWGPVGTKIYYNRSSSPLSPACINVGALPSTTFYNETSGQNFYHAAPYSSRGPRTDIFAATNVVGAKWGAGAGYSSLYPENTTDSNANKIGFTGTGTSFSCPQVAGVCALYLQLRPNATSKEIKNFLQSNSLFMSGSEEGVDVWRSQAVPLSGQLPNLYGAPPYVLRFPFIGSSPLKASNVKINFPFKLR